MNLSVWVFLMHFAVHLKLHQVLVWRSSSVLWDIANVKKLQMN